MKRKRTSRRRLKARFKLGRWTSLEDIYNHRLVVFVETLGYISNANRMVKRSSGRET